MLVIISLNLFKYKEVEIMINIKNKINKNSIILSVSSITAGILNGFAGTGGGIILYFVLKYLNKFESKSDKNKDIMAMIISAVIPMSIVSAIIYMTKGNIIYSELLAYLPAALTGGIIGALLLDKLNFKIVKKLFAVMIIYAGIKMIL